MPQFEKEPVLEEKPSLERSLVFVKPFHHHMSDDVLRDLDVNLGCSGSRIATVDVPVVPRELVEQHYAEHRQKKFYDELVNSIAGRSIMLAVYEGKKGLIRQIRSILGPTDPLLAPLTSIRGCYGCLELHNAGERGMRNVLHASANPQDAKYELEVWQSILRLEKFNYAER